MKMGSKTKVGDHEDILRSLRLQDACWCDVGGMGTSEQRLGQEALPWKKAGPSHCAFPVLGDPSRVRGVLEA